MKDSFDRIIDYLRISVTDLCNIKCKYCMPLNGVQKLLHADILRLEEIEKIAKTCIELGIKKIRITGGEPLVRKNVLHLIQKLGNIDKLQELALTTNGILLKQYAYELKNAGLKKINISIDTLDPKTYFDLTRGGNVQHVLDGIEAVKKYDFESIKLNVVLLKGINEHAISKFIEFTKHDTIEVRFIELMPLGNLCHWANDMFIPTNTVLQKAPLLEKVYMKKNTLAAYYKIKGYKGNVGLISSRSNNFCDKCNRIRLTANGKLKLCLHDNKIIDLKTPLRNNKDIHEIIKQSILQKPKSHKLETKEYTNMNMFQIGG